MEIVNNDFADVAFGRTAMRVLDRDHKIPRAEMLQIIKEATRSPSAVNTQPWRFVVVDTDEGKQKLESYMWEVDRGRIENSSATVIILADTGWLEDLEYTLDNYMGVEGSAPGSDGFERGYMQKLTTEWALGMTPHELELSVTFQAGLVTMMLMLVARAHGYDSGPMDAMDREGMADDFGLDGERFKVALVVAIGKGKVPTQIRWRRAPEEVTVFA
jgi:nitroreductase